MRRKDKEITNRAEMESIIRRSMVCRLALADENLPYLVPLCFGSVSYTHLRAHETGRNLVCRLLLENSNIKQRKYLTG